MRRLIFIALFLLCVLAPAGALPVAEQAGGTATVAEPSGKGAAEVRVLIIPAEFSDIKFTLSREGFKDIVDEAEKYWKDQCPDWQFEFYVAPKVSLSRTRVYYGGNDFHGSDYHPDEFVRDACTLSASVDFGHFDADGDGLVDHLIVFYPDRDEADDPVLNADCLWSQAWHLSESENGRWKSRDGVFVDTYALVSELGKIL